MSEIKRNIEFRVLNEEKIARIHEKTLYLMEHVGMKVDGERAVELLTDCGARLGNDGRMRIGADMVEKALASAPKELTLYNRDGEAAMVINSENQVYFGTHSDQLELVDPFEGGVRKFLKKDIATMCRVADSLPNIHFVLSVGMTADVDPRIQTQSTFIETLKHFSKTINFSSNDVASLKDCINIAADFAGGLKELQEKPFLFYYCEPIPPLTHPADSTEKAYISAENRIPFNYMPYSMMGGTTPMSSGNNPGTMQRRGAFWPGPIAAGQRRCPLHLWSDAFCPRYAHHRGQLCRTGIPPIHRRHGRPCRPLRPAFLRDCGLLRCLGGG